LQSVFFLNHVFYWCYVHYAIGHKLRLRFIRQGAAQFSAEVWELWSLAPPDWCCHASHEQ